MRKEVIFAIVVGLLIGLVVTYGVYTANKALSSKKNKVEIASNNLPTPLATVEPTINLSISAPADNIVVSESTVKVEGSTLPDAIVAIITEDQNILVQADSDGIFQQEVPLIKGANTIEVTATDLNLTTPTKTIQIVYSTEVNAVSN